jgi:penicillin-binding protein 2
MSNLPSKADHNLYFRRTILTAKLIVLTALAVIAVKLWHLQVVQGENYVEMSISNRMRMVRLAPSRGKILDDNGTILAENKPGFIFSIVRGLLDNPQRIVDQFSDVLGIVPEKIRSLLDRSQSASPFLPFIVKKGLSFEELSLIKSSSTDMRGATIETRPLRRYPLGETLCHVIGTLGEISPQELSTLGKFGYASGDFVGKSGIEKEYDTYLKGQEGWEQIEIDAKGRQLREVFRSPANAGGNLYLTVDSGLQKYVEDIFVHRAGSVVVMDPDTGRILALVSKPGFDLNMFSPAISDREWKTLNSDPLHPLENRSIRGLYPPASTFKIVMAAAALAEKVVRPDHKFVCSGELEHRGLVFRCWNQYGHGPVDLYRAIVESCDIYFYEIGLRLGIDRIARWASYFGFGKPSGIGLPQELPGLFPSSPWKMRTYGEPVKEGEILAISIGQGYVSATPLQLAVMTASIANGGKLIKPFIVSRILSSSGEIVFEQKPVTKWTIPMDAGDLELIRSSLRSVVTDPRGTGKKVNIPGVSVRGKTGTSQVVSAKQQSQEGESAPYHERTHAMFVAIVDDRPNKLAIVVIVEHGGGGGTTAAPLARKIICRYYGLRDPGDPTPKQ